MKLLLSLLFSILLISGFAQQSRSGQLIPVSRQQNIPSLKSLEAKFTANVTQGIDPLSVQFTDQSTGNPTRWKWFFGDGDSSLIQNPLHIYKFPGLFSVKLTVSDGITGTTLEKKDFIKVSANLMSCDTLHSPLPEPLTYYINPEKGYVTGNNLYGDIAVAEFFENKKPNLVITGLIFEFCKAIQAQGHNENLQVKIWKANELSGKPVLVLYSDTIRLSKLVNDVKNNSTTSIDFSNPVKVGSSFYVGIMFPELNGDTICVWSTKSRALPDNTTWVLQGDQVWTTAQKLWTPSSGPDFIISTAIYPKVCLVNGIDENSFSTHINFWPNPATEIISIINQKGILDNTHYSIFSISGKELIKGSIPKSLYTSVDVSKLKPGIYILKINGKNIVLSSRLVIK